jgi:cytochrome c peroxidase
MHTGYIMTLKGVTESYNSRDARPACPQAMLSADEAMAQGCWPAPEVAANVNSEELGNLKLRAQERKWTTLSPSWKP